MISAVVLAVGQLLLIWLLTSFLRDVLSEVRRSTHVQRDILLKMVQLTKLSARQVTSLERPYRLPRHQQQFPKVDV